MWRVLKHKGFSVFMATFVVVLLSGVALAQVSVFSAGTETDAGQAATIASDWVGTDITDAPPTDKPTSDEAPAEEPKERTPAEEPKDPKPAAEEPKDETPPADEPKDEKPPAEEPKDDKPAAEEPKDESVLLKITSPADGAETEKRVIRVEGLTDHDAVVTMGKYQADRDAEGNWAIHLTLHNEKNIFPFRAQDKAGNVAEASITVYYVGEPDEPDKPDYEFTAHQRWDATDDTPPKNHYWGTATPGAKIWIVSHYGEKRVQAGPEGGWEAGVVFEGAPHGEKFKVVVESSDNGRAVFYMKVFYPEHEEKHEFTANQKYGSCGEDIPYDVFWGTATPDAKVWVESGHGGGMVHANDLGHWEIRVDFPEAPFGEPFKVYVESNDGGSAEFKFVRTGGEHTK